MVQVVDNLTQLSGRMLTRQPHPQRADWDTVVVHIDDARAVEGKADLLSRHTGEDLPVAFRRDLLGESGPGVRLTFRARFTAGGVLAEPHPGPAELRFDPPAS